ncbi:MAG: hypothetical protein M3R01_07940, partial [Actinomycetota bacterium]|nr:hypothetical protein [Actinomycetota bacterium]
SWPDAWLGGLERVGETAGRPRRESESVREYVRVIRPLLQEDDRWPQALRAVEWAAFSGELLPPGEQALADAVLAEAPGRR